MTSFDKLVDSVDNSVFNTVSEYLEDVMGEAGHEYNTLLQEKVLVALLKKYRPENVIFVEEEVDTPKQVIYGVFNADNEWICDVSGITEGELADDLEDAMNDDTIVFDLPFEIGQEIICFVNKFDEEYELRRK